MSDAPTWHVPVSLVVYARDPSQGVGATYVHDVVWGGVSSPGFYLTAARKNQVVAGEVFSSVRVER